MRIVFLLLIGIVTKSLAAPAAQAPAPAPADAHAPIQAEHPKARSLTCPSTDYKMDPDGNSCIILPTGPYLDYNAAKEKCAELGDEATGDLWTGRLAEVRASVTIEFLVNVMKGTDATEGQAWIGGHERDDKSGLYSWESNDEMVNGVEDTNKAGTQCLTVMSHLEFNGASCNDGHFKPLCQLLPQGGKCDEQPWLAVAHTQEVVAEFKQFEGVNVALQCELGYTYSGNTPPFSGCKMVAGVLHWVACGGCEIITQYCKTDPTEGLNNIEKVTRNGFRNAVGDKVIIRCKMGFATESGEHTIVSKCAPKEVDGGVWEVNDACVPVDPYCQNQPQEVVPKADLTVGYDGERRINSVADIACRAGWKPTDGETIPVKCKKSTYLEGKWEKANKAVCQIIVDWCSDRPDLAVPNTLPLVPGTFQRTISSRVQLSCRKGFQIQEMDILLAKCAVNREWHTLATCTAIKPYCDSLSDKPFDGQHLHLVAAFEAKFTVVDSEVELECDDGYEKVGGGAKLFARCIESGEVHGDWRVYGRCQEKKPYCKPDSIWTQFAQVQKISVADDTTTIGSTVPLNCLMGSAVEDEEKVVTSLTIRCDDKDVNEGQWNSVDARYSAGCHLIIPYCDPNPSKFINYVQPLSTPLDKNIISASVDLDCMQGYKSSAESGKVTATCSEKKPERGTWTHTDECIPIDDYCPKDISNVPNVVVPSDHPRRVGSVVTLKCKPNDGVDYVAVAPPSDYDASADKAIFPDTVQAVCRGSTDADGIWETLDNVPGCDCYERVVYKFNSTVDLLKANAKNAANVAAVQSDFFSEVSSDAGTGSGSGYGFSLSQDAVKGINKVFLKKGGKAKVCQDESSQWEIYGYLHDAGVSDDVMVIIFRNFGFTINPKPDDDEKAANGFMKNLEIKTGHRGGLSRDVRQYIVKIFHRHSGLISDDDVSEIINTLVSNGYDAQSVVDSFGASNIKINMNTNIQGAQGTNHHVAVSGAEFDSFLQTEDFYKSLTPGQRTQIMKVADKGDDVGPNDYLMIMQLLLEAGADVNRVVDKVRAYFPGAKRLHFSIHRTTKFGNGGVKYYHWDLSARKSSGSNGHGSNGHGSNGHGSNGHGSKGHGSNGHGSNGSRSEGGNRHQDRNKRSMERVLKAEQRF